MRVPFMSHVWWLHPWFLNCIIVWRFDSFDILTQVRDILQKHARIESIEMFKAIFDRQQKKTNSHFKNKEYPDIAFDKVLIS